MTMRSGTENMTPVTLLSFVGKQKPVLVHGTTVQANFV